MSRIGLGQISMNLIGLMAILCVAPPLPAQTEKPAHQKPAQKPDPAPKQKPEAARKPDPIKKVPPSTTGPFPKPAGDTEMSQPLDMVLATVDKKAILLSDVRPEYLARIAGLKNAGARVVIMAERQTIMRQILEALVERATVAQAAKNLGGYSPKDIEAWLERHSRSEMERSIQRSGSLNKFRKELERFGTSTFAEQERVRQEALLQLSQQDLLKNIGDQMNLMVRPKEMHDLWQKVRKVRARPPSTTVSIINIRTEDRAKLLAAAWTDNEATAEEMTQKPEFPGAIKLEKKIQRGARRDAPQFMIDFAAGAKLEEVSRPYRFRNTWWVLKAVEIDAGDPYDFQAPHVQRALRIQIANIKFERLRRRQTRRSQNKVSRWQMDIRTLPMIEFMTPEERKRELAWRARRAQQRRPDK